MNCKVGSIPDIHQRLIQDGYRVSEYALRQWVKKGILKGIYSGNKALIAYDDVLRLFSENPTVPTVVA